MKDLIYIIIILVVGYYAYGQQQRANECFIDAMQIMIEHTKALEQCERNKKPL